MVSEFRSASHSSHVRTLSITCVCGCVALADFMIVALPGQFNVWLASREAEFLKGKFVWVNWDVDELKALAEEIKGSALLKVDLNGVPM